MSCVKQGSVSLGTVGEILQIKEFYHSVQAIGIAAGESLACQLYRVYYADVGRSKPVFHNGSVDKSHVKSGVMGDDYRIFSVINEFGYNFVYIWLICHHFVGDAVDFKGVVSYFAPRVHKVGEGVLRIHGKAGLHFDGGDFHKSCEFRGVACGFRIHNGECNFGYRRFIHGYARKA